MNGRWHHPEIPSTTSITAPALVAGKDWSMDTDWEDAAAHVQRGYLAMLAIDSLLAFMSR